MTRTAAERIGAAHQVRRLVAEGRYAEAQRAFEDYCQALAQALAVLPPKDARIRELEDEWGRLLGETRGRVLAGRAQAAVRLARLSPAPRLYGDGPEPARTWQYLA
jgi:hypothetical protein